MPGRPESTRKVQNKRLNAHIKAIYKKHKGRYGSPKIADELNDNGFQISKNSVAQRMKEAGLRSIVRRRYRATTNSNHTHPVADNLLKRDFSTTEPNRVWVTDITYIATERGWLYLTVFLDLYSRMVVGWALSSSLSSQMVQMALNRAIKRRQPEAGLIIHSDRGVQYASKDFRKILDKHNFVQNTGPNRRTYENSSLLLTLSTFLGKSNLCS